MHIVMYWSHYIEPIIREAKNQQENIVCRPTIANNTETQICSSIHGIAQHPHLIWDRKYTFTKISLRQVIYLN